MQSFKFSSSRRPKKANYKKQHNIAVKQPLTANHINYCARGSSETQSDCLKRKIVFGEPETLTHSKPSITLHSLPSAIYS